MWRFRTGFFTLNHWSFLCFICRGFSAHKEGNYESKVAAFWGKVNECTGVFQATHSLNKYVQGQNKWLVFFVFFCDYWRLFLLVWLFWPHPATVTCLLIVFLTEVPLWFQTLELAERSPETLKYWVGVQRCQSYLMGRRCIFSLGWQPFW